VKPCRSPPQTRRAATGSPSPTITAWRKVGILAPDARVELIEGEISEPQPDLALLRERDSCYSRNHPGPADVLLVVEVADSACRSRYRPCRGSLSTSNSSSAAEQT
jgi:hypothetical protein